ALDHFRHLDLDGFNEATTQAQQRRITLQSLELLHGQRPDVQVFNKLLVQYPQSDDEGPGQVVPDNMVVLSQTPIDVEASYDVPLQPAAPFWVLEYLPPGTRRRNSANFGAYEKTLQVAYFLVSKPDTRTLRLHHHTGKKYVTVKPNEHGRCAIAELDLEVGLLDGWVRYWYK